MNEACVRSRARTQAPFGEALADYSVSSSKMTLRPWSQINQVVFLTGGKVLTLQMGHTLSSII